MKEFISWDDVTLAVDELVERIKKWEVQPTVVYGIPRGGLALAVMLSHRLDITLSTEIVDVHTKVTLIVDDIVDSGQSLLDVINKTSGGYNNRMFAVSLHYSPNSFIKPTEYIWEKDNDNWIVYPWETEESEKDEIPDYKRK